VRAAAGLLLVLAIAGGCGGGDHSSEAAIDLAVTLWPNGEAGDSVEWNLRCEPTGGDHPDAATACAALTAIDDPFGEMAPAARCEEIPGSDEAVATVTGDFRGRQVDARFSRENACVAPRWDRIAPVFPAGF
jgi:hypothetical protein